MRMLVAYMCCRLAQRLRLFTHIGYMRIPTGGIVEDNLSLDFMVGLRRATEIMVGGDTKQISFCA